MIGEKNVKHLNSQNTELFSLYTRRVGILPTKPRAKHQSKTHAINESFKLAREIKPDIFPDENASIVSNVLFVFPSFSSFLLRPSCYRTAEIEEGDDISCLLIEFPSIII